MLEQNPLSLELIRQTLRKFNVEISDSMARQTMQYIDLLMQWNQKISLTSVTDLALILERHFGESLLGAVYAGVRSGFLLDIGSGAGFPALPITMLYSDVKETLLEPNGKKAVFLAEVCRRLEFLNRVSIVRCRLEGFPSTKRFDFITSRAVTVTPRFLERCAQLLQPNGRLVLWLGDTEARAAEKNDSWSWNAPIKVPGSDRRYVISGVPKTI